MTIDELTPDQLEELRTNTLCELFAALDMGTPSYYALAVPEHYVTDSLLWEYYENTIFSNDDFFCTAGI